MLATAIILFREVLEATLIIGILAAATRDIKNSRRWQVAGVLVGLTGSGSAAAESTFRMQLEYEFQ
jgi:high-affinity iron transporter